MDPRELVRFFETIGAELAAFRTMSRDQVECYLGELRDELVLAREEIRLHQRQHASRFNVFDYVAPDENRLSDILADLLDPAGTHGQGDTFLRQMAELLSVTTPDASTSVTVVREELTTHLANPLRRIDIVLDFGKFGIGIENKPWAGEQEAQVKDYILHLNLRYGGNFLLVYLTGDGSPPRSVPVAELIRLETEGRFRLWAYSSGFLAWLDACESLCQAQPVRWFLDHFRKYVRDNFTLDIGDWRQTNHAADQ